MDNQAKINDEVQTALRMLADLILDLSWATPDLQDKSGWKNVHGEVTAVISRIDNLNRGR